MIYGFIKLVSPVNKEELFMECSEFDRYANQSVFRDSAVELVIYDKIHIGCFPLMFRLKDILDYNSSAILFDKIPLSDICFKNHSTSVIAKILGCENC